MKSMLRLLPQLFLFLVIFLASCKKDETVVPQTIFKDGIFITNEGLLSGSGTISFFNPADNSVKQDIFELVNGRPLGSIVQSMYIMNHKGYIVVNNGGKIEIVNDTTFKSLGTITGLTSPRYFLPVSETKAYVSDWSGFVDIVDLSTNTVTGTIPAGNGPDIMLKAGQYVYVLNGGGFENDKTVTVINYTTDQVVTTINVFDRPTGIVEDAAGKIWIMCSGKGYNGFPAATDTPGHLHVINPETFLPEFTLEFLDATNHPEKLVINSSKDLVYYLHKNAIYKYHTDLSVFFPELVVKHANLYSLSYDASQDYLYAFDPLDYSQNGWVIRYRADNGKLVDSIQAGIIPGSVAFNQ